MGPSVLVVDDQAAFRAVARALLERDGFDVVGEAVDGTTALLAERDLRPDVVLLDVRLPDRSGLDVARAIGALPNGAQVVLTSTADYSHAIDECGARGFVPKVLLSGPSLRAALAGPS
jgi:DNA-binding NarL/FixJ family response regulator